MSSEPRPLRSDGRRPERDSCYLIGYAVTNISASLAIKQVVLETLIVVAMAVVVA